MESSLFSNYIFVCITCFYLLLFYLGYLFIYSQINSLFSLSFSFEIQNVNQACFIKLAGDSLPLFTAWNNLNKIGTKLSDG